MSRTPINLEVESSWRRRANVALIGLFIVTALSMIVLIALSLIMPPVLRNVVESYTDAAPEEFPVMALAESDRDEIEVRIDTFEKAIESSEAVEPLTLTEPEINGLLQEDDDLKDRLALKLRDGHVEARMSLPIDRDLELGPWTSAMKGRYLNGVAVLEPRLTATGLKLKLSDFRVRNESVPGWLLSPLQRQIDQQEWLHSQDVRDTISRLSALDIVDGELVLYPKNR